MSIELYKCDITEINADAVVNAANRTLIGRGGVDGRIHEVAGDELYHACEKLGGCDVGQAKITPGFKLKANYIIHAVGPIWKGGQNEEEALLKKTYQNSLNVARANKIRTIAFPNISTGIYRFPKERAALIAIQTIQKFLAETKMKKVVFACFEEENFHIYSEILNSVKPGYF